MILTIELDATEPQVIGAVATDKEGNPVEGGLENLKIEIQNPVGDFGTIEEQDGGTWVFNPGAAGASGEIRATADLDGVAHEASAVITLKPGAASDFSLKFSPVAHA